MLKRLKELITKGVGAEFTTYYYYTILRMHCTGLEGEGIKEIVRMRESKMRNHFEAMTPRLYELGGGYLETSENLQTKQDVLTPFSQITGRILIPS